MRTLSPLELSSGLVIPERRRAHRLPDLPTGTTPRAAAEAAILPALRRAPCVVSFSGGRDSSAVLALATHLARREGLPLPIPVTHRFPTAGDTQETEWQEEVVGHLGLDEWVRIEAAGDLDCVGPIATRALRRHGVLWPCNALLPRADPRRRRRRRAADRGGRRRGVLRLELGARARCARPAACGRCRATSCASASRSPRARSSAPSSAAACRSSAHWLQPAARREIHASIAAEAATEPLRWRHALPRARRLGLHGGQPREPRRARRRRRRGDRPPAARPGLPRLARRPRAGPSLPLAHRGDADARRRPAAARAPRPRDQGALRRGVLGRAQPRAGRPLAG